MGPCLIVRMVLLLQDVMRTIGEGGRAAGENQQQPVDIERFKKLVPTAS